MQVVWVRVQGAGDTRLLEMSAELQSQQLQSMGSLHPGCEQSDASGDPQRDGVQCSDRLYISVLGATETTQFPLQSHYSYYKTSPDLSH